MEESLGRIASGSLFGTELEPQEDKILHHHPQQQEEVVDGGGGTSSTPSSSGGKREGRKTKPGAS